MVHSSRVGERWSGCLNLNNLAYRETFGGSASFDAYRADLRVCWRHAGNHVLAVRR